MAHKNKKHFFLFLLIIIFLSNIIFSSQILAADTDQPITDFTTPQKDTSTTSTPTNTIDKGFLSSTWSKIKGVFSSKDKSEKPLTDFTTKKGGSNFLGGIWKSIIGLFGFKERTLGESIKDTAEIISDLIFAIPIAVLLIAIVAHILKGRFKLLFFIHGSFKATAISYFILLVFLYALSFIPIIGIVFNILLWPVALDMNPIIEGILLALWVIIILCIFSIPGIIGKMRDKARKIKSFRRAKTGLETLEAVGEAEEEGSSRI